MSEQKQYGMPVAPGDLVTLDREAVSQLQDQFGASMQVGSTHEGLARVIESDGDHGTAYAYSRKKYSRHKYSRKKYSRHKYSRKKYSRKYSRHKYSRKHGGGRG